MESEEDVNPDLNEDEETIESGDDNNDNPDLNEDDNLTNKITVKEFIKKERISPWVASVFIKTLDKDEYTENTLNTKYEKFLNDGVE